MYECMYACVCTYICINVYMHLCMCVLMLYWVLGEWKQASSTVLYVCMFVCVHVCMCVCLYVCMFVCVYVCMCVYLYVCMFVCACFSHLHWHFKHFHSIVSLFAGKPLRRVRWKKALNIIVICYDLMLYSFRIFPPLCPLRNGEKVKTWVDLRKARTVLSYSIDQGPLLHVWVGEGVPIWSLEGEI